MRRMGYVLLALGALVVIGGLASHFAAHPYQLLQPVQMLDHAGVVLAVFTHPASHPSTILGLAGVAFTVLGLTFSLVRRRSSSVS